MYLDILYRSVYTIGVYSQYLPLRGEDMETKDSILACALALFSAKGYDAVSVQELVDMAGITKPTLYYYFGSKEGLFATVLADNYTRLDQLLEKAAYYTPHPSSYFDDVYPVLTSLTSAYFSFAKHNEAFYRMVLANLFQPSSAAVYPLIEARHFTQYQLVGQMFANIAAVHTNMRGKETMLAWTFIGMVNSYIGLYYNSDGPTPYTELDDKDVNVLVRQFMHGIFA